MVLGACALPLAPMAYGGVGIAPVPAAPCNLPTSKGLIVWLHVPGAPDSARAMNESDLYNCRPTLETWRAGQPSGPGYCSKIAWFVDNPTYAVNVSPAAPLNKVIDQVGDC
ncbi:hypothetical protein A5634_22380 [Mycobacterium asiaticum]|uniref:Uncharacterized protein n=1 Tax=Mycobacterium asiaticum TaxID=1790 RepID=A0A1A3P4V3_MYCAS|nr:hypothetical protein A5634_22380 [Mycobacterium asiaticum]